MDLEKYKSICLWDNSWYESELWRTGTGVSYCEVYDQKSKGKWVRSHGATRLDEYERYDLCPCCGQFGNHWVEQENGEGYYSCGGYKIYTMEEMQGIIADFEAAHKGDEDYYVEYKEESK